MQNRVVEAVVPVHDRRSALRRQRPDELVSQGVERRQLSALRALPLLRPAAQLTFHEAGRAPEVGEPDFLRNDCVEPRERLDQRATDRLALLRGAAVAGRKLVAADVAEDPLHHVEARSEHAVGFAEVQDPGHRNRGRLERRLDAILPHHVVGGRKHVTQRRPAKHHLAGIRRDAVGEIGLPAGDQRDLTRAPALVVEDLREVRPDDVRLGAGHDRLEALRGRVGE